MRFHRHSTQRYRQQRGVSLVVVIFAMMILGILGWTLANFIAGDFETSIRALESEQALYIAEAGIQEAVLRLRLGDESFNNDSDVLSRIMSIGQYYVNRSTATDGNINITSSGYVPAQGDYRAMRQVAVIATPAGALGVSAFTGGYLFDWYSTTSISIKGNISAEHYLGPGNLIPDESQDRAIPPLAGYARLQGTGEIPPIDMQWFYDHKNNYAPGDLTISDNMNNMGIYYVKGNVIINSCGRTNMNIRKTYLIAEGDISVIGDCPVNFQSRVQQTDRAYPVLATENGKITISGPLGCSAQLHQADGLIYSRNNTVDINCLDGAAVMAREVQLRGAITLQYDSGKYVDMSHGFNEAGSGATAVRSWVER